MGWGDDDPPLHGNHYPSLQNLSLFHAAIICFIYGLYNNFILFWAFKLKWKDVIFKLLCSFTSMSISCSNIQLEIFFNIWLKSNENCGEPCIPCSCTQRENVDKREREWDRYRAEQVTGRDGFMLLLHTFTPDPTFFKPGLEQTQPCSEHKIQFRPQQLTVQQL